AEAGREEVPPDAGRSGPRRRAADAGAAQDQPGHRKTEDGTANRGTAAEDGSPRRRAGKTEDRTSLSQAEDGDPRGGTESEDRTFGGRDHETENRPAEQCLGQAKDRTARRAVEAQDRTGRRARLQAKDRTGQTGDRPAGPGG